MKRSVAAIAAMLAFGASAQFVASVVSAQQPPATAAASTLAPAAAAASTLAPAPATMLAGGSVELGDFDILDPRGPALQQAVLRRLKTTRSEDDRRRLQQIATEIAVRHGEPFWQLPEGGHRPAVTALVAELRRAGEWGLPVASLGVPALPLPGAPVVDQIEGEIDLCLALARYVELARGHRVDPVRLSLWLDQKLRPIDIGRELTNLAAAADPAAALRGLHPHHPEFERLRQAYLAAAGIERSTTAEATPPPAPPPIPAGPALRPGASHPHVALIRQRLGLRAGAGNADYYDKQLAAAVRKLNRSLGRQSSSTIDDGVRRAAAAMVPGRADPKRSLSGTSLARKLLVNMDRWRWLPDDLGDFHVWNNLPEYQTRIFRNGEIIFEERIIIGKRETQTPVFNDTMRFVVFNPEWGVPPSLKVKDLLPHLQAGDDGVLARRNMRIVAGGKEVDPSYYDWGKTDIRKIAIVQHAGPGNPLGTMKFMFPNKHAVYMHDTPNKGLFNASARTLSNGCIRVRNPLKFASLVMSTGKGWGAAQINASLAEEDSKRVDLDRTVPVYNVYFTVRIDASGKITQLDDIYGHDKRMLAALDGKPIEEIAKGDPARALEEQVNEIANGVVSVRSRHADRGGLFGGGYFQPGGQAPAASIWSAPPAYNTGGSYSGRRPRTVFESVFGN